MPNQLSISVTANPNDSKSRLKKSWVGEPLQRKGTFTVSIGENIAEDIKVFGESLVHNRFAAQVTIDAAAVVRGFLEDNKSPQEIQTFLDTWKPGTSTPRITKVIDLKSMSVEAIKGLDLATMSVEAIQAFREKVSQALKAKQA